MIRKPYYSGVLFPLLSALYVLVPGHPELPFAGIPIGQTGVAALVGLALVGPLVGRRSVPRFASLAMIALIGVKIAAWAAVPEPGWLARYYANATFEEPAERSIDYRRLDATRIDRALAFADTSFPVHFFNDRRFDRGFRREYTDPFSARWTGHLHVRAEERVSLVLRARGQAMLSLDGREAARVSGARTTVEAPVTLALSPGPHIIEARYSKPPDIEGLFELRHAGGSERPWKEAVLPRPAASWRMAASGPLRVVAAVAHLLAFGLVLWVCAPAVAAWFGDVRWHWSRDRSATLLRILEPAVVVGLTAQGLWKSRHLAGHVWTLTGGDDWMTFEHNARDVVLNGILMTQGAAIGQGTAYFAYPGYTYFTAFVHVVTGESLAGVILMNFVVLAVATVLVLRLARLLVPAPAAVLAVSWLLVLQQADFVRYYTMTLLSENLYVATTAGMVLAFTRYIIDGRVRHAIQGGAWGGASALTRPSAMLFLPFAAAVTAAAGWRRAPGLRPLAVVLLVLVVWMAVILPATVRNSIVSGEAVLISSGQAKSFIDYNMPPDNQIFYLDMFDGSLVGAAIVLARMLVDQPRPFLSALGHKVGFSLGMVHWSGMSRPHPELLLTSVLYVCGILVLPVARTLKALPLHLFVLTHLAALTLSLPWNYGYRLILPMYPFMSVFAMAVPARVFSRAAISKAQTA